MDTTELVDDPWKSALWFDELCELGAQFIEGKIDCFPGYGGSSPAPETACIASFLADFNRAGFLTTCSQPGDQGEAWSQRAFVQGYALGATAKRLAKLELYTDLIVCVFPPEGRHSGYGIAVTIDEFRPFTWAGMWGGPEELEYFKEDCDLFAFWELATAVYVAIIDPHWGRNDYLWPLVAKELHDIGDPRYSPDPVPHLKLERDFLGRAIDNGQGRRRRRNARAGVCATASLPAHSRPAPVPPSAPR